MTLKSKLKTKNKIRVVYAPINNKGYTIKDQNGKPFLNIYRKKIKKGQHYVLNRSFN